MTGDQTGPLTVEQRVEFLERRDRARDVAGRRLIRRAVIVVIVVVSIASFGTWRAEQAGDTATDTAARVETENIDRQVAGCQSTNEFRRLFRDYLESQGKGVDPGTALSLDGFDALPPEVQGYVRSLVDLVNVGAVDAKAAREDYVARFPIVDCAKVRARLEAATDEPGP